MNEKIKKIMKFTLFNPAVYLWTYLGLLEASNVAMLDTPKINSESQLVSILEEEKENLGCDKLIHTNFMEGIYPSYSRKNENGSYDLVLNKDENTVGVLRHELYHIHAGHCEGKKVKFFPYLFKQEPSADLYSIFGLDFSRRNLGNMKTSFKNQGGKIK